MAVAVVVVSQSAMAALIGLILPSQPMLSTPRMLDISDLFLGCYDDCFVV